MSEWKKYKLGDLGTFFGGVTTIKREDYGFGTPFITYKNVYKNSRIDASILELMNVNKNDIIKRNCIYGDIFFTASSETPDEVAMSSVLLDNIRDLTFNGFCKRFRLHDFNTLIPKYARYLFRGEDFRNSAYEYANGDVRFNISQESLSKISINIPSVPTQTTIAEILYSLDDKIELNNQINQNLEALAQALFKQWFVDFEFPNENGEPYKSSGGEMIDSELGEIPKGWKIYNYGELLETVSKTYPLKKVDQVIFLNTGDIQNGKFLHKNFSKTDQLPGQAKKSIQRGDILYSEIRPQNKRFAYVHFNAEKFVVSTKLMVLRPKVDVDPLFMYFLLTQEEVIGYLQILAESRSGTFPQITFSEVSTLKIALPEFEEVNSFSDKVLRSYFEHSFNMDFENEGLSELRDTLLPKLISGELEVSEVSLEPTF